MNRTVTTALLRISGLYNQCEVRRFDGKHPRKVYGYQHYTALACDTYKNKSHKLNPKMFASICDNLVFGLKKVQAYGASRCKIIADCDLYTNKNFDVLRNDIENATNIAVHKRLLSKENQLYFTRACQDFVHKQPALLRVGNHHTTIVQASELPHRPVISTLPLGSLHLSTSFPTSGDNKKLHAYTRQAVAQLKPSSKPISYLICDHQGLLALLFKLKIPQVSRGDGCDFTHYVNIHHVRSVYQMLLQHPKQQRLQLWPSLASSLWDIDKVLLNIIMIAHKLNVTKIMITDKGWLYGWHHQLLHTARNTKSKISFDTYH